MIAPVMPVYRRSPITMVKGEGCYLFDDANKRYLDFATGIAVNALGHCHPHVTQALKTQADQLWHCSNMYQSSALERMAARLVENTFADSVFFSSSGAEAIEAAVKMIRRYHAKNGNPKRNRIITFEGGFHGRTMVGISAGGNDSAREGYAPLVDGFDRAKFNDLASIEALISDQTAGILIEAVQGEGGIRSADLAFLKGLRTLADKHGLLLAFDEVQCGMSRSGKFFAFEYAGVVPDVVTTAKGIGNGFPLSCTLAVEKVAAVMTPGSHGSTYGANPLAMAVGNAVLDVMLAPSFLEHVNKMGAACKAMLERVQSAYPLVVSEVRGVGLILGIKTIPSNYDVAAKLRTTGLLTAPCVSDNVIRILPPLIITEEHLAEAETIFTKTFEAL